MSALAGYLRRICLLIACLISISRITAQEESARFLWGMSDSQGFIAHVSSNVPIQSAELLTSAETIELTIRPLESETWFILDASATMVNTAPAIQAALQDYPIENALGFINFAASLEILPPSTDTDAITAWLGNYHAFANESACLADALNLLDEQAYSRDKGRQVIAIVGEYQACDTSSTLNYPVIFIVVGADARAYEALGTSYRASLQNFRSVINNLNPAPIYALEGSRASIAEGEIRLNFENGESLSLNAAYDLVAEPTPIPSETATEAPSATTVPSETPTERLSSTATEAEEATETTETTEEALIIAPSPEPVVTETPEITPSLPVSDDYLILGGGVAAVLVVIVVMVLLLREARRPKLSREEQMDNTMLFQYNDEAEIDQTDIVSMREIMAQIRPTLAARLSNDEGVEYEIHRPITTVGRREDSDIRIENDKQISREHLRFTVRDDGSIWVTRLTQNPVLINEIAIETILQIREGDVLQLSPSLRLKLEIVADE